MTDSISIEQREAELWKASEYRYRMRRDAELRALWRDYHLEMANKLERCAAHLAQEHRRKAESLQALVALQPSATLGNGRPSAKGGGSRPSVEGEGVQGPSVGQGEVSETIGERRG
jgi:hypothetical protein